MKQLDIQLHPAMAANAAEVLEFELANREFFRSIIGDYEDSYYQIDKVTKTLEEAEAQRAQDKSHQYLIWHGDELIGRINLRNVTRRHVNSAHLGARIAQKYSNQGVGTAGLAMFLKFAFHDLALHRLETSVVPHNTGSHRVLEKYGFVKFGHSRRSFLLKDVWHDLIYYELHAPHSPTP